MAIVFRLKLDGHDYAVDDAGDILEAGKVVGGIAYAEADCFDPYNNLYDDQGDEIGSWLHEHDHDLDWTNELAVKGLHYYLTDQ